MQMRTECLHTTCAALFSVILAVQATADERVNGDKTDSDQAAELKRAEAMKPLNPKDTADPAVSKEFLALNRVNIDAAALSNANHLSLSSANFRFQPFRGYAYGGGSSNGYEYGHAAVSLPQGSTVRTVLCYFYDNHETRTPKVYLRRVRNLTGISNTMAQLSPVTNSSDIQIPSTSSISNGTIDNTLYSYYVMCYVHSSDTRIYRIIVFYD